MSNDSSSSKWKEELSITLNNGWLCDFNRLLYMHCPNTQVVQAGRGLQSANRDSQIIQLKDIFSEKLSSGGSHSTWNNIFRAALRYLIWCDKYIRDSFTKESLDRYFQFKYQRVQRKEIKNSAYIQYRASMVTLFKVLDLPTSWFENVPNLPRNDFEPFEAYSQSDLKKLLPLLRALFKQTSAQFLENPEKHTRASRSNATMSFQWQDNTYPLHGAVSKMMVAATYLLSYYTSANTTILFNLPRPQKSNICSMDTWYSMPAFKRRAFKTIHVEMGEHTLDIPKYSMQFFDTLLRVSKIIDSSDNALLIQTTCCLKSHKRPLMQSNLQTFNQMWLKKFNLTDERGRELRPVISRFRETGSQLVSFYQGDIAQGVILENTLNVRRKHYSTGNKFENQAMMQETALIREQQAKNKVTAKEAQLELKIDVLTIDASQKIRFPNLSRIPNGSSCSNPFGERSAGFSRKARQNNLTKGEKLACADLLQCFGCEAQVIVQSVSDIWCLLSFKECLEESLYLHLDASHFRKNFENVLTYINKKIMPKLTKSIVKEAEKKLNTDGRHPLWQEVEFTTKFLQR
ncbi:hypothetical protein [Motilimonas cestriensis]|uniref:hypothetical protein n=1 Tax=Motilimonas cestriensis TaxID=2742685 RepID=UPI003DA37F61